VKRSSCILHPASCILHPTSYILHPASYILELTIILVLLAAAAFFRLYPATAPPGLYYDEAYNGVDALEVLRTGQWPIYFPHNSGREPLFLWLVTLSVATLGRTVLALRLPAVLVGLATVPVTYLLVRVMFAGERRARSVALATLATAWLTVSHWHVHFSRMGFRAISLPLMEAIAFGLLWWALHTSAEKIRVHPLLSASYFALAGAALGLCLYTYTAGRFTPLVPVAFFILWIISRLSRRSPQHATRNTIRNTFHVSRFTFYVSRFTFYVLSAALIALPLAAYAVQNPIVFAGRSSDVAVWAAPDPARALLDNVVATVGMFGLHGDVTWRHNLAGKPVFDPLTALLFYAGVLVALWRWRRPPYTFLLAWLGVMLLPGLISQDAPHFLRTIGIMPAIFIFPAITVVEVYNRLNDVQQASSVKRQASRLTFDVLRFMFAGLALVALLLNAGLTFHDYFTTWAQSEETFYAYHGDAAEIAGRMNELAGPGTVFLLPVSYLWPPDYSHKTIDFLYQGRAPYYFPHVDEGRTPADLTALCRGVERVYVVTWTQGDHVDADPKRLVDFLLRKAGSRVGETPGHGYLIEEYRVPPDARFALPTPAPAGGNFALQLALRGAACGPVTVRAGGSLWVLLEWETLSPPPADYKVTVYLHDGAGHGAGQADALLLDNEHRLTRAWAVGSRALSYGIVEVPPDTPPGDYRLDVGVYDPATMQRLWVKDGDIAVTVGTVQVRSFP